MLRSLVSFVGLSLLLTAAPAAPVPTHLFPKTDPLYFPTRVGTKWVYLQDGREAGEKLITAVEDRDGGKLVSVNRGTEGKEQWLVSAEGLFVVFHGGQTYDPHIPMLRLPHKADAKWDALCKLPLELKGHFAAHGPEDVEVPAGKFRAIRVEVEWVGVAKATVWYAPGVGEVKSEGGLKRELKSFTPAKD